VESVPDDIQKEIDKAKKELRRNFDEFMDRASGWYKRRVQMFLLFIGLAIAAGFNADTFEMYNTLSDNPANRQQVIALAQNFVENEWRYNYLAEGDTLFPQLALPQDQLQINRAKLDSLIALELSAARSPLGIGRTGFPESPPADYTGSEWMWRGKKLLGWIVTALAISLGAPFWFDLLKHLMSIRGGGNPPPVEEKRN
jgi:hypothetical protein